MSSNVKRLLNATPEQWIEVIKAEYAEATSKFGKFNSPHEGWAVIREEVDELWEHVKNNDGSGAHDYRAQQDEARQIAAMALRYLVDLC